ncbi:efflux RND transporter periplasmic adaptor subunit [Flavisolibacter ginsengisoli]|jgi:HlyD family secretion protein|uniref:HlyD family secretion protein n=1 Tax=Flavisolibacter ginsengisoli DSM 18119 TaxID=1121884 RepID=A0A1M4SF22_9BACT|nr:efflux RND transporter periplasmic adaptor subunit [Flavisolibacter ginsengisoli]SHE30775.1 HlyD family secretion protein [Flavisolibacter ginsengisoli DSM 18119]
MKKRSIILIALLILAAVATVIYFRNNNKTRPVDLQTTKAQYGYIGKSVTATGTIQPVDTVIVGAQVSGVVKAVYADFNNTVKKGQLLAKVDPSIVSTQIEQAKATLANAQSNLEYQVTNFNRQQQLFDLGAISKADYQLALNQYNIAKAVVNNASAQVKLSQRNLYYTNIYSPITGVVLNKNISAGQTIASSFSSPTLFVIAKDLSKIQVNANVDEADIGGVKPGQHVSFTVDAFPDELFYGTVQKIYLHPYVSANVVTYPTLITIDNRQMKLRPGMTASITIYTQEDSNALLIPAKALRFKPDSSLLIKYVLKKAERLQHSQLEKNASRGDSSATGKNENNRTIAMIWIKSGDTLIQKKVWTGMNDGTSAQVIKGLKTDEEVITGVNGNGNATATNAQRSPFMPQMRRQSGGGQRQRTN